MRHRRGIGGYHVVVKALGLGSAVKGTGAAQIR